MNIRALIVDDEPLARERLKTFIAREPDITVMAECANGREAIAAIETTVPDLLFLDVQMPRVSGFDVLRAVGPETVPAVIFVTAYDQHALEAFEVHALDYLVKPFKPARFKAAIQRARERLAGHNGSGDKRLVTLLERLQPARTYITRFVVKSDARVVLVNATDVDWIESAANYALLHVGDKTHVIRETMTALEEKLDPRQFQRISRSAFVNLDRIQELQPMLKGEYVVILKTGKQLGMTRGIRELQAVLETP
jgi:two-component system LytT family response regulator